MTRETKVGIVVACSFVGLVGVVIASKLREPPPGAEVSTSDPGGSSTQPEPARAKGKSTPPPAAPKAVAEGYSQDVPRPDADVSNPTPKAIARVPGDLPAATDKSMQGDPASASKPGDGSGALSSAPISVANGGKEGSDKTGTASVPLPPGSSPPDGGSGGPAPPPPSGGVPLPAAPPTPATATAAVPVPAAVSAEATPAAEKKEPSITGTASGEPSKSMGEKGEKSDGHDEKKAEKKNKKATIGTPPDAVAPPAPASAPVPAPSSAVPSAPSAPTPTTLEPPSPATGAPSSPPRSETPGALPAMTTPSTTGEPKLKPEPVSAPPPEAVGVSPPPAPMTATPPVAVPSDRSGGDKPEKATAPLVTPAVPVITPSSGTERKEPPRELPSSLPTERTPTIAASTARQPLPPVGGKPTVESFSELEHIVKSGDTFETISAQYYKTSSYAEALRLYNRNDSLLSNIGRNGAEKLESGQRLSIPDAYILEKRYGDTLSRVRPASAVIPTSGPEEFPKAPTPVPAKDVAPVTPKPVTYRVPEGPGQTMYEIAKATLGDGKRWTEIHNLNQQRYKPEDRIPAGAEVLLPADARVVAGQP